MAQANTNWPVQSWAALFSTDPNTATLPNTWSDLSPRVTAFDCGYGTQYELGSVEAGTATLDCRNDDEALNPANTSSPFNSSGNVLVPYRRVTGHATWPSADGQGNLLNEANATMWGYSWYSSTFESAAEVGNWEVFGSSPPTIANSSTQAHDGTRSMRITWPTAVNGGLNTVSDVWIPSRLGPFKIGETYRFSVWMYAAAGVPKMRIQIGGTAATSAVFATAWQRVSVTWVCDTAYAPVQVYPDADTTAGQLVYVDSVQIEIGSTTNTFSTTGPITYPLFSGYIERYPLTWKANGYFGSTRMTAVDALAVLARFDLSDAMSEDISQDTPMMTYRLDEPAGARSAEPAAWAVSRESSQYVSAGGAAPKPAFGYESTPNYEGGTSVSLAPASTSDFTYLYMPSDFVFGSAGSSMEVWFSVPANPTSTQVILAANGSGGHTWDVGLDSSGHIYVRTTSNATTPVYAYTITDSRDRADNSWHHIVVTESHAGGTVTGTLYVDGEIVGSDTRTAGAPFYIYSINVGATGCPFLQYPFSGRVAWASAYGTTLDYTRVGSHYRAALDVFAGDLAGERIRRIIPWAGWDISGADLDEIADGYSRLGPATGQAGATALGAAKTAAGAENGYFLAEPNGDLALLSRDSFYLQTAPAVTFGEDTTGGEIPYQGDIAWEMDPQFIYNQVTVTGAGGELTSGTVTDTSSVAMFYPNNLTVDTVLPRQMDVNALAGHLLNRYKDARLRIAQVTIDPASNPTLWPVALGLAVGTRVRVKRRTRNTTMSQDFYVLQRDHKVAAGSWLTSFQMFPVVPEQPWILGDATYGVLGTTTYPAF